MDDLKDRLSRIEKQGIDGHISNKLLEASFDTHRADNEKDFRHVDECIHRSDAESRERDDAIMRELTLHRDEFVSLRADFTSVKAAVLKATGALLVLVPLANYFMGKFL